MSCGYSYRMINTVDKERFQQTFAMSAKKYFSKEDYVRETQCYKENLWSLFLRMFFFAVEPMYYVGALYYVGLFNQS